MWETYSKKRNVVYTTNIKLNLSTIVPCLSGPKRPQDKIELPKVARSFMESLKKDFNIKKTESLSEVKDKNYSIDHGHVAIAAITSCTNTSNPSVMLGAGILAKKAYNLGLRTKPWVKTSLAPGSKVVTDYLINSGTQ